MSVIGRPTGEKPETEYTLADYGGAIYRRKWMLLIVVVAAVVAAGLVSRALPRIYEASVVFYVPRDVESSIGIGQHLTGARLPSGLQDHARAYADVLHQADAWYAIQQRIPAKPLREFARDLDIAATREGAIRIYCRDEDPQVAADVANAMVTYFNEFHHGIIRGDLQKSLDSIDLQIQETEQRILDAAAARQAFQEEHGIASMGRNIERLESERQQFISRLLEARVQKASAENELRSLDEQIRIESERYVHGKLLETREGAFHRELRQRKALLEVDLSGIRARIEGLGGAIATLDATVREVPGLVSHLQAIDDDIRGYREARRSLERSRDDLKTRSLELRSAALVIREARPPSVVAFPRTALNMGIAAIAGLFVGAFYALLLEAHALRRRRQRFANYERERSGGVDTLDDTSARSYT